jgi:hypothetical protein
VPSGNTRALIEEFQENDAEQNQEFAAGASSGRSRVIPFAIRFISPHLEHVHFEWESWGAALCPQLKQLNDLFDRRNMGRNSLSSTQ